MDFRPRAVPRSHVKTWLIDAIELSKRRIAWFVALAVAAITLVLLDPTRLLFHCTFPVFIAAGCLIARSADLSLSVPEVLQQVDRRVWIRIFLAGATPWIFIVLFVSLIDLISSSEPGVSGVSPSLAEQLESISVTWLNWLTGIVIVLIVIAAAYFARFLWFLGPLLGVAEIPLAEAVVQSFDALKLNRFVTWVFVAFLFWLILCGFFWVLFFPWLAVAASTMYVSYRDIWLGNFRNEEVREEQVVESGAVG